MMMYNVEERYNLLLGKVLLFFYYVKKFCDKDIFEYVPRTHSYRMGISWAFSSRKPFLHEQRVLCSYCWQMACSFRFEHCWLYVQDSKRFLAEKRTKLGGLATLVKKRPSRSDVFHFEQTSNCLDNLVTFSALFLLLYFPDDLPPSQTFFRQRTKGLYLFSEEKTWPFLVFFWKLTLASILLLWCGHITSVYLSAFYMTFMRDDGEPLFGIWVSLSNHILTLSFAFFFNLLLLITNLTHFCLFLRTIERNQKPFFPIFLYFALNNTSYLFIT